MFNKVNHKTRHPLPLSTSTLSKLHKYIFVVPHYSNYLQHPIQTYTCTKQYHYLIKDFIDRVVWLASLRRGSWLASLWYTVLDIVWNAIVDCQVLVGSKVEFSYNMLRDKAELRLGVHSIIVSFLSFRPDIKVRFKYAAKGLTKTIILIG